MQPPSIVSELPLPENLREGQIEVAKAVAENDTLVSAKLPTGYGKTLAFCASFMVKRHQGEVDYLLYLVPRDSQVRQAAEEVPRELRDNFGLSTTSVVVRDDPTVAIRRLQSGKTLIFVTTIQSLATSQMTRNTLTELLQYGNWFFAVDEYHNLPLMVNDQPGRYWAALSELPRAFTLAMTATPRMDNGNDPFPEPRPRVRYTEAAEQGYVKPLRLHHYEYRVDGIRINGELVSFSTSELEENTDEIEQLVLTGQMRWSPKYISPLILIPAERMLDLRLRGIRSQMLVRAVSCSHAELIASQIKVILPTLNVDWVGTGPNGRSDEDNRRIIDSFCPPKGPDGLRHWSLDVLVQRGIASEGLDTVDVTELVFACPVNGTTQDLQFAGRGARRMRDQEGKLVDVIATINVDSSTAIAQKEDYLGSHFMRIFDSDNIPDEDSDEKKENDQSEYDPDKAFLPEEPRVVLADVSLVNVRTEPGYTEMFEELQNQKTGKSDEELHAIAENVLRKYISERDRGLNASSINAQLRQQINNAVGKIVSRLVRRLLNTGIRIDKTLPGDMSKRIRTRAARQFGKLNTLDERELREQYDWLRSLEADIAIDDREKTEWLM